MTTFSFRFITIVLGGLVGATLIGLLSPNETVLILGIITLGIGMVMAILFYLLRPIRTEVNGTLESIHNRENIWVLRRANLNGWRESMLSGAEVVEANNAKTGAIHQHSDQQVVSRQIRVVINNDTDASNQGRPPLA